MPVMCDDDDERGNTRLAASLPGSIGSAKTAETGTVSGLAWSRNMYSRLQ
jgi:hypothetical protein